MIKKLGIVFILFATMQSYAQQTGTASPYSFFGIGSFTFDGTAENRAMGGISFYTDSIHFNFRNPASYTGENLIIPGSPKETRPVKFTVGGSTTSTNLENISSSITNNVSTFDYLGFSFPVGKFGIGLGLLPFTSVGYQLESFDNNELLTNRFSGDGGISRAFLGIGYRLAKGLNIGVDINYNFGDINNSEIEFLRDSEGVLLQNQSREINTSDITGFNYNFGITYVTKLNKSLQGNIGITYTPGSDLTSDNERTFETIIINQLTGEVPINEIIADLGALGLAETDLTLPSIATFGLGVGKPNKWFFGAEYSFQNTTEFSNRTFNIQNATFEDGNTIAVGGYYVPDYNALKGYFKRVVYRAGFNYEKTGLVINDESINEFGISFGLGLPVGRVFSNANIAVELGQRGTTNQNLVREQFVNVQLSLSLSDIWFNRRKFD